ncbi:methyltransferase domain-containing protein [Vibrio cholerae]|uniref:class I SAM-dependent methyltransferase n=1 Tax=Vibrio cholerae TaxID=666 RepID=UPI000E6C87F6|nr:methyltransferase domain-containing protein [Vibrio cholerae]EGR4293840.1 methyltransferase domain-containing protein [Vibrio cholerae]EGR4297854.1 methyltransferase domain-containing protein [Vibrio cholerae]
MIIRKLRKLKEYFLNIEQIKNTLNKLDQIEDLKLKLMEMEYKLSVLSIHSQSLESIQSLTNDIKQHTTHTVGRLENVRDEILYELRVTSGNFTDEQEKDVEVEYISPERIIDGNIRLNLGCGHIPIDEYINVDARKITGVDLVADVTKLPFEENTVDEIYCAHLVEHFTDLHFNKEILPHWYAILKPGSKLKIIVPDAESMSHAFTNQEMPFEDFRLVTFGAQDYTGDFHYNMFSAKSLCDILKKCGFKNIKLIEKNRRNGLCRELEVHCEK